MDIKVILIFIILGSIYCFTSLAADDLLSIKGDLSQGSIVLAEIENDIKKCFINNKEIPIYQNKVIFAFARDDSLVHNIKLIKSNNEFVSYQLKIDKEEWQIEKIDRIPKKYTVKPKSEELIARINREYHTISDVRKNIIYKNRNKYFDNFIQPIQGRISGEFGSQRIINGKPRRPHFGLDIAAEEGTDVKATSSGVVVLTGDYYYNGKFVLIDHGLGISSIYIHLSDIDVHLGQKIEPGEVIGKVGNTGRSTGPHLHWGMYWYNIPFNPLKSLAIDKEIEL